MENLTIIPTSDLAQMLREICQYKHKVFPGRRVGKLEKKVHAIKAELRKRNDRRYSK